MAACDVEDGTTGLLRLLTIVGISVDFRFRVIIDDPLIGVGVTGVKVGGEGSWGREPKDSGVDGIVEVVLATSCGEIPSSTGDFVGAFPDRVKSLGSMVLDFLCTIPCAVPGAGLTNKTLPVTSLSGADSSWLLGDACSF